MEGFAKDCKLDISVDETGLARRWLAVHCGKEAYVESGLDDFKHCELVLKENTEENIHSYAHPARYVDHKDFGEIIKKGFPATKTAPKHVQVHAAYTGLFRDPKSACIAYLIAGMPSSSQQRLCCAAFGPDMGQNVYAKLRSTASKIKPQPQVLGELIQMIQMPENVVAATALQEERKTTTKETLPVVNDDSKRTWNEDVINSCRQALDAPVYANDDDIAKRVILKREINIPIEDLQRLLEGPLERIVTDWRPEPHQVIPGKSLHHHLKTYILDGFDQ